MSPCSGRRGWWSRPLKESVEGMGRMWTARVSRISVKTLVWGLIGGLWLWGLPPVRADLLPAASSQPIAAPTLPPSRDFAAVLLQDADSGQVLFARHEKRIWPLASLTKMMVGLTALEALRDGRVSLHTPVPISRRASRAGGRSVNLRAGERLLFGELLQAMLVTSANGAAIAVAEQLSGSVEAHIRAMNARAAALGMHQTRFQTVNGLPPSKRIAPDRASASDMTILARALLAYPQLLEWTSRRRIPFRAGKQHFRNTNFLVGRLDGVDGLKTGYTAKARFNLVTTAKRNGLRLIAVVLGGRSSRTRFRTAASLLEWGFTHFTRLRLIRAGQPLWAEVRVEDGSVSSLQPVAGADSTFLVRKRDIKDLHIALELPSVVKAPVADRQVLGHAVVRNTDQVFAVIPALSPGHVPETRWRRVHR